MRPIKVPPVRQAQDYSCGAACLASCLYYWKLWDGREPELYQELGTTCDGTKALDIVAAAWHFAYESAWSMGTQVGYVKDLTLDQLKTLAIQGFTCILNIQAWGEHTDQPAVELNSQEWRTQATLKHGLTKPQWEDIWDDGHYVVLVDLADDYAVLMDPALPGCYGRISIKDLEARWHDWSDDGQTKEYHTAIIIRSQDHLQDGELMDIK